MLSEAIQGPSAMPDDTLRPIKAKKRNSVFDGRTAEPCELVDSVSSRHAGSLPCQGIPVKGRLVVVSSIEIL